MMSSFVGCVETNVAAGSTVCTDYVTEIWGGTLSGAGLSPVWPQVYSALL